MHAKIKLDALTSLRFVAAAIVVVGHAHQLTGFSSWWLPIPTGQGVSFFFVLSGFILAYNYPVLGNRADVLRFYVARFARVWPLHAITCFLWILLVWNLDRSLYFPGEMGLLKLLTNLLLLQTWLPWKAWSLSFNGVSWSLSNEFFFYALFPILIASWSSHWHRIVATSMLWVVATLTIAHHYRLPAPDTYPGVGLLGTIYFNPVVRLLEFVVGMAVAQIIRPLQATQLKFMQWCLLETIALAAVAVALIAAKDLSGLEKTLGPAIAYYFTREGLWLFWALLIGVLALSRGPLARILSLKPLVFLGEISFGLYLIHSIVIHYFLTFAERWQNSLVTDWGYGVYWALCLSMSSLLFIGFEQPMRKLILACWDKSQAGKDQAAARNVTGHSLAWNGSCAAALAGLAGIVVAMLLLRPSLVVPMQADEVGAFLRAEHVVSYPTPAVFNHELNLLGIQMQDLTDGQVSVRVLLQAKENLPASTVLALHVNDQQGRILAKPGDYVLDKSGRAIAQGTQWLVHFKVQQKLMQQAKSLGFVVYRGGQLFPVTAVHSDWDGKRLLVNLPNGA